MVNRKVISELVCEHCGVHFIGEYMSIDTIITCGGYCKKETAIIVFAQQFEDMCDWCPEVEGYVAYILMCKNGRYYKGYTSDFKQRMRQHFNLVGCKTTKSYKPDYILHYEVFDTRKEAIIRENFFKKSLYWIRNNHNKFNPIYPSGMKQ